ncbi:hypothetical protein AGMMS50256_20190 [Betaproteobacteria bacterium]|nr:hypothetical protein AGMMS50256_20190 [Betaproteobacteria bacterium]
MATLQLNYIVSYNGARLRGGGMQRANHANTLRDDDAYLLAHR